MKVSLVRAVAVIGVLSLLAGATAAYVLLQHNSIRSAPASPRTWDEAYFTNTEVVTHDGRRLRLYDDLLKGKIVVINFIYTSCKDLCSLGTARLALVRERLGARVGKDIFFYSITLDPVIDGPDVLKKYADNFYTGPGWLFLTGAPDDIDLIRYKLGDRGKTLADHRTDVILGNDATGEWSRDSIFSDTDHLTHTILRMDPKERARPSMAIAQSNTHGTPTPLGDTPGRALFVKTCAACHSIGGGDRVGPDLAGVTQRRSQDWLVRFIVSPSAMIRAGDQTALALLEQYRGLRMPEVGLTDTDARDLIAYIDSQTITKGDAATAAAGASTPSHPVHSP